MDNFVLLTPDLRIDAIKAIDEEISKLNKCEKTAFVNAALLGYNSQKNLFKALPDGYPVPVRRNC